MTEGMTSYGKVAAADRTADIYRRRSLGDRIQEVAVRGRGLVLVVAVLAVVALVRAITGTPAPVAVRILTRRPRWCERRPSRGLPAGCCRRTAAPPPIGAPEA
jgi:hypothetical protein